VSDAEDVTLSLVIPARNEGAAVEAVLHAARAALAELPIATELILVDDCSGDDTGEKARRVPEVQVLRNPRPLGYGHSLLRGMDRARGRWIAISDADGSYPASGLLPLWREIEAGADHAIALRGGSYVEPYLGLRAVYRWLCAYVVGERVPDANSGLRIFDRALVDDLIGDLCRGFSFTTSLTLASILSGFVVVFVEVPYAPRVGRSHVRRVRDTLRTMQYLVQIIALYNPLKLFLPLVVASTLLSLGALLAGAGTAALVAAAATLLLAGIAIHAYIGSRTSQRLRGGWRPRVR
jgi:glycosyltransferase involved in cell wall biosynthesis